MIFSFFIAPFVIAGVIISNKAKRRREKYQSLSQAEKNNHDRKQLNIYLIAVGSVVVIKLGLWQLIGPVLNIVLILVVVVLIFLGIFENKKKTRSQRKKDVGDPPDKTAQQAVDNLNYWATHQDEYYKQEKHIDKTTDQN